MVPPTGLYQLSTVVVLFRYLHVFYFFIYFYYYYFFLQYALKKVNWMEKWQCCEFPLLSIKDVSVI